MSLINKKTRIDAKRVAEIIGCSRKTVLNGGAGTAQLTRIRNGSRQVRFILEEVIAFAEKQEQHARRLLPRRTNDQDTHGHRQVLSI
jgi:predicted DNA-binding transcriptional regulator AlpA